MVPEMQGFMRSHLRENLPTITQSPGRIREAERRHCLSSLSFEGAAEQNRRPGNGRKQHSSGPAGLNMTGLSLLLLRITCTADTSC